MWRSDAPPPVIGSVSVSQCPVPSAGPHVQARLQLHGCRVRTRVAKSAQADTTQRLYA